MEAIRVEECWFQRDAYDLLKSVILKVLESLTETKKNLKVRSGAINNYLGVEVINRKWANPDLGLF